MEVHQQHFLFQKVYRLFPSSCHFRSIPEVAENSITNISKKTNQIHHFRSIPDVAESSITTISKKTNQIHHFQNDHSSSFRITQHKLPNKYPKHINRYKTPLSNDNDKKFQERKRSNKSHSVPNSSSANSGWFSSSDEKNDTFVSFSSNSGDSFRLKTSQRFRKYEEMKKIDETERCSLSSIPSFHTLLSNSSPKKLKNPKKNRSMMKCSKVFMEYELGPDQISTQLYYSKNRRKKTTKKHRKVVRKKNSNNTSIVIENSYAVEKSSNHPYGDFRASMVEMIVEKQMFGAEDMERLLQCFLSLNAVSYHEIILDVFSEICETLFSN